MEAIGGYFELELRKGKHYHENALRLNSARNAFEYILRVRNYKKIYIPYYTCEVMLQPLKNLGIEYEFYHIKSDLEPTKLPTLKTNEAFLYTNYFGLKQATVQKLSEVYHTQLIIDNSQAFFAPPINGIDTFYSARKFFGVADGAYLYTDKLLDEKLTQDKSYNRMLHLLQRIDEGAESAFSIFQNNDRALDDQPIKLMSTLTDRILCGINYQEVIERRRENYIYLSERLSSGNYLEDSLTDNAVPMIYPYFTNIQNIKEKLISQKIFIPTYWTNVQKWCQKSDFEYLLMLRLAAIPIDQRYGKKEMEKIIRCLL